MEAKDKKKLHALWADHCEGDVYPATAKAFELTLKKAQQLHERRPGDFEEAYAHNAVLNLMGRDEARRFFDDTGATHGFPITLDHILDIGIYRGIHDNDVALLKDALHTWNRLRFGYRLKHGWYQGMCFRELIHAMADGDVELMKTYMPRSLGLAPKGCWPFFRAGSNLVAIMLHDGPRPSAVEQVLAYAQTYSEAKKNSKGSILVIRYLLALQSGATDEASGYLQSVADEYRRMSWIVEFQPFLKYFGAFVHGLYHLAQHVLPADRFAQMTAPRHSVFSDAFDRLSKARAYQTGGLIPGLSLSGELSGLQRLFGPLSPATPAA